MVVGVGSKDGIEAVVADRQKQAEAGIRVMREERWRLGEPESRYCEARGNLRADRVRNQVPRLAEHPRWAEDDWTGDQSFVVDGRSRCYESVGRRFGARDWKGALGGQ